jgi:hypothetical protein
METINPVIKVPRSIDFRLRFPTATLDPLNGGKFWLQFQRDSTKGEAGET